MTETVILPKDSKFMPVFGCLARRLYVEAVLEKKYRLDPCLLCEQREKHIKTVVCFP